MCTLNSLHTYSYLYYQVRTITFLPIPIGLYPGTLWSLWEPSGALWEPSGALWEPSGASGSPLEPSGNPLEPLGALWSPLGTLWSLPRNELTLLFSRYWE
jgi:hypothetical protein